MAETYSGEFYCVKCKAKREASGEVHVNEKGTRMAKAKCPVCGTNLNRGSCDCTRGWEDPRLAALTELKKESL